MSHRQRLPVGRYQTRRKRLVLAHLNFWRMGPMSDIDRHSSPAAAADYDNGSKAKSADRALMILPLLDKSPQGLTETAIGRRLTLPSSSTHYLVKTLVKRGFAYRDRTT